MPQTGRRARGPSLSTRLDRARTLAHDATDGQEATALAYFPRPSSNPFQTVLYGHLWERGIAPVDVKDVDEIAWLAAQATEAGRLAFHLHWTYPILRGVSDAHEADVRVDRFLRYLEQLTDADIPLIWTVHNVLPHDCQYVHAETRLRRGIADRSTLVHTLGDVTAELTSPYYDLPAERTRAIPHPTYDGWYPTLIGREQARADLGLGADTPTFVLVGNLRAYKGLGSLFDAFERVRASWPGRPRPRLLVAGRPFNDEAREQLRARVRELGGASIETQRITDDRVATYLQAADVVVLPYERILNSGVLLAAMTYSRTTVIPRTGCLPNLVTDDTASIFEPGDVTSLAAAMARAMSMASHPGQAERVREVADRYHPQIVGPLFADAVEAVLVDAQ